MNRFIILYESEARCLERLAAAGLTGEPAREVAAYLAQATDLAAYVERITTAFAAEGVEVLFFELGAHAAYIPLLQADPSGTVLWNVTDGFRYYRGSLATPLAALLDVAAFGSPPQAQLLCQDKYKSAALAAGCGVATPPVLLARDGRFVFPQAEHPLEPPFFVKPNTLGAKLGIWADSRCDSMAEALDVSRRISTRYGDDAVIQPYLPGRDVRVSFLAAAGEGQADRAGIYALVDVDSSETGGAFMTMRDNWTLSASRSAGEAHVPGPFAGETVAFRPRMVDLRADPAAAALVARIDAAVERLVACFDLRDVYSFDFRVTPDEIPYFLEFEVCPAVTIYDFQTYLEQTYGVDLPAALFRAVSRKK